MGFYTPIIILVLSNLAYQLCSKNAPAAINPLAMLTITYIISALVCVVLYYVMHMGDGLIQEYKNFNLAGILMGFAIVGMEVGTIYMYKVGWQLSVGALFANTLVAVGLLVLGVMLYKDAITFTKLAGIGACLIGMFLINK